MKYDKNTIIGFTTLFILLAGYFYYNSLSQKEYQLQQKRIQDSIATVTKAKGLIEQKEKTKNNKTSSSSSKKISSNTGQKPKSYHIQNDVFDIVFNKQGASIEQLFLKKYKDYNGEVAEIILPNMTSLKYFIRNPIGKDDYAANLIFSSPIISRNSDSTINVEFIYGDKNKHYLAHTYTLRPNDYKIDLVISYSDQTTWFKDDRKFKFTWETTLNQLERSSKYEKTQTQMVVLEQGEYDYFSIGGEKKEEFDKNVKWVGVKQQFFCQAILSNEMMSDVKATAVSGQDDTGILISKNTFSANVDFPSRGEKQQLTFSFYAGPNDYDILKSEGHQLERIVNYGQGIYAFIRPINIWVVKPVFSFLQSIFPNYGIAILFLTLIIRTITSPLAYRGYVSSAKMKSLRPEMDEMKAKYAKDKQTFALKQMELYRSAGVNPLGGCIPALLQLPIFVSLYYFFNATIEIRGKSFLWCRDISSYDSIIDLGFNIPFYGDHVSLFTLFMVITTILSTIIGMGMNPSVDNSNPAIKYMPYIMPIIFLGFFNSMPAALTWYYTVSNIITFGIQTFIQRVVINHDKIALKIKEYRSKPKKKNNWQERIEKYQSVQKQLKNMKEKKKK